MSILRLIFLHKTASMFAHAVGKEISKDNNISYFSANNKPKNDQDFDKFIFETRGGENAIYGPCRQLDEKQNMLLENIETYNILQVRHPLDLFVSMYFSWGWIHPTKQFSEERLQERKDIQTGKLSIYSFIDKHINYLDRYNTIFEYFTQDYKLHKHLIVKYEDMVLDYDRWSEEISTFLQQEYRVAEILKKLKPNYTKQTQKNNFLMIL
jgi:hypothetical protein